ncbi:sensor histidine kinase [Fundidesulfovibrio terrae]|uniref:sensor histidine kinase n=1 Tax=Fundidesulfovibrio terrae TaxID=2922866 RepID=UPI001FAEB429|nr:ATP-binding protein [Fundidesulfovibrio terrae]
MPDPKILTAATAALALAAAALPFPWSLAPGLAAGWCAFRAYRHLNACLNRSESQKCALDEQLFQSQKLAAIGEVASGIAHEINNPLAVITQESEWLAHLLDQPGPPVNEARESLATIRSQVNRCADITHNLLNLARTWKPIRQPADLNRCVEDMARLAERDAKPRNIALVRNYDEGLPKVPLDPPLMRQAVLNLLVNAVQAVGKDGMVTVSTGRAPEGRVFVRVADNGPGIPHEHLGRVFDPFFTTKAPGKGTGLGLSITQRIVDRLGGFISAANQPPAGAAFTITLPLRNDKPEDAS